MTRSLGMSKYEHWTKAIFRQNLIPLQSMARRLGMSYEYLSAVLSGSVDASKGTYEKLEEFAFTVLKHSKDDPRDEKKIDTEKTKI